VVTGYIDLSIHTVEEDVQNSGVPSFTTTFDLQEMILEF
jgi:hypothetical protein